MNIELSDKEFRRLVDLVYIGNWVLNSIRPDDLLEDYELLQEKFFRICSQNGLTALVEKWQGRYYPSRAYEEGGIHEAIADYEDAAFFDILAEELARRDMILDNVSQTNSAELSQRIGEYMDEFSRSGIDNLYIESD